MNILEPGKRYTVFTAKGEPMELVFCHTGEGGSFIDGITSEELMKVLIDRHGGFARSVNTMENMNILTHLQQTQMWMNARNVNKQSRKRHKKKAA